MMEQGLDYLVKVKLDLEEGVMETYIYSLTFILMNYLNAQMKTYFLSVQFLLQMQLWELLSKYQLLMEEKLKLKFQQEHRVENNSD